MRKIFLHVILILIASAVPATAAQYLYWNDHDSLKIERFDTSVGVSSREDVITGLTVAGPIQFDTQNSKMYYGEGSVIRRANFDGTSQEVVFSNAQTSSVNAMALDVSGGKIYWTNNNTDSIYRSNFDGSSVETLVTGVTIPSSIVLDVNADHFYYTDLNSNFIGRANLDGSGQTTILSGASSGSAIALALDISSGKMYWSDFGVFNVNDGTVRRANLDGSSVETLLSGATIGDAGAIALDLVNGVFYFNDQLTNRIQSANFDGSGLTDVITTGVTTLESIALLTEPVPEPMTLVLLGSALLGLLPFKRNSFKK